MTASLPLGWSDALVVGQSYTFTFSETIGEETFGWDAVGPLAGSSDIVSPVLSAQSSQVAIPGLSQQTFDITFIAGPDSAGLAPNVAEIATEMMTAWAGDSLIGSAPGFVQAVGGPMGLSAGATTAAVVAGAVSTVATGLAPLNTVLIFAVIGFAIYVFVNAGGLQATKGALVH